MADMFFFIKTTKTNMKQFVIILIAALCSASMVHAQKYLDHLQQRIPGQGTVIVKQSKEIDELVNGKAAKPQADKPKTETSQKATPRHHEKGQTKKIVPDSVKKQTTETTKKAEHNNTEGNHNEETDTPTVDMHKKVMRGSYKVTGYRVQAYAGGNSRNDRLKAERIGNAIKMRYPDQPVYVHFYSPRWICRVGNFRSLGEARKMLSKIRAMGYRQACLVKGKITVQY